MDRHPDPRPDGAPPLPGAFPRPSSVRVRASAVLAIAALLAACGNSDVTLYGSAADTPQTIELGVTASGTGASLAWNGGPDGLAYRVSRNGAIVANVDGRSWTDSRLVAGERYCWTVYGLSGWGFQARSNEACTGTDSGTTEWRVETIAAGRWPAVAVDASGEVHVCFTAANGVGVSYLRAGPGRAPETVDSGGTAQCSISVSTDGTVHVAYLSRFGLRHATRAATGSAGWRAATVDVEAIAGVLRADGPALALDAAGTPRIAYRRISTNGVGALAVATGSASGGWTFDLTGIPGLVGPRSLSVDAAGTLRLAATDSLQQAATAWRRTSAGWRADYVQSLGPNRGDGPPLALDPGGAPRLAWWWRAAPTTATAVTLRWARLETAGWVFEDVASLTDLGTRVSVASRGGTERIAAVDAAGTVRLYVRGEGGWTAETLDAQGGAAAAVDLAIAGDGQIRVVFDRAAEGSVVLASRTP
jgi:hypothetical protein